MRCALVHKLSSEYLDGALDDARSSALRGHLRTCPGCAEQVADEQAIRFAARDLSSNADPMVEPPADMWRAINARLAAEEIADAEVSPLQLWVRRLGLVVWPYRAHIAATAALLLVVGALMVKQSQDEVLVGRRAVSSSATFAASGSDDATPGDTQLEAAMREIRRADSRYLSAIVELRELAGEERASWTDSARKRYDQAVAEFESRAVELRATSEAAASGDPRTRDGLYELYRRHIKFLEDVVFDQVSALGGAR